jgi:hypothetical protein
VRVVSEVVVRKGFSENKRFFASVITDDLILWETIDTDIGYIRFSEDGSYFFEAMAIGVRFEDWEDRFSRVEGLEITKIVENCRFGNGDLVEGINITTISRF